MKRVSLKWKLMAIGMSAVAAVGVLTVSYAAVAFRAEIGRLYLRDYTERIRNIEFEYEDLQNQIADGSAATDADTSATTSPTPRVPAGTDASASDTAGQAAATGDWSGRGSRREALLERLDERFVSGRSLDGQLFIFTATAT